MSGEEWLPWGVPEQSRSSNTYCIVNETREYVTEIPQDFGCASDDTMEQGQQWQIVTQSPVSKSETMQTMPAKSKSTSAKERVQCHLCYKSFASRTNLNHHIRLHSGEKPYACDECGQAFARSGNLKMHKRIHTGERPFMCGICGKTFNRSSHLNGHMLQHTGDKPYACETCGQHFSSAQGKKNHMRLHVGKREFQCELCSVSFTHRASLRSHVRVHSKESQYHCSICKRKFVVRSALYEHMTLHSRHNLFECDKCHKRFKQKYYLKTHKNLSCCNKSPSAEENTQNSANESSAKYRKLKTNAKALPSYSDSEDDDDDGMNAQNNELTSTGQQKAGQWDPIVDDKYLDNAWAKVLKKLGYKA